MSISNNQLLTKAGVQYNDYTGTVAADRRDLHVHLDDFLTKKGFDISTFFPFALKFVAGEPFNGDQRTYHFVILSVKRDEVGDDIKKIREFAQKNNGIVPTYSFSFHLMPMDFFKLFKRFEIDIGYNSKWGNEEYDDSIAMQFIQETSLDK